MKLLTVIVNYKTAEMTADAVRSALREMAAIEGGTRLSVVDNDSADGSLEKLRAWKEAEGWGPSVDILASDRNGGFGYGNNFAIRPALESADPPDYVYLLNSDAFPDPGAIEILLKYMDANRHVGFAGSYVHGVDGRPHVTGFRFPKLPWEFIERMAFAPLSRTFEQYVVPMEIPSEITQVDWIAGASMMIRREVLETVGLFDENFFLYFEEVDLCLRARLKGWPTYYVPASSVAHVGSASTGIQDWSRRIPQFLLDSRRYYFLKNYGRAYFWGANAAWLTGHALRVLRCRLQRKQYDDPPHLLRDFTRHLAGLSRVNDR